MLNLLFPVSLENSEGIEYDAVVLVGTGIHAGHLEGMAEKYLAPLSAYKEVDARAEEESFILALPPGYPIRRLVYSPVVPCSRGYGDVRRFAEAGAEGIQRAITAGSQKPLLILPTKHSYFANFGMVTVLGALHTLYVPLEVRESIPCCLRKVTCLGVAEFPAVEKKASMFAAALAVEQGRIVCRDIGGSDPERMSAPRVAEYVQQLFKDSPVKVEVIADEERLCKEYPLMAAVNRAARGIARHQARMIFLTYTPVEPVTTTLFLVGKGVTYDTGGADVKAGGIMAGMHRDKCGAAAVAGFFKVLSELRPKGVKVYGAMAMVRNSIGSDGYVSDEILTSRAGIRVRVRNTDAEGRMAMADVLCQFKNKALHETNPYLFTIATLTSHATLSTGEGYSVIMDNGPAQKKGISATIQAAGEAVGDMFSVSHLRREDISFVAAFSEYEEVLQGSTQPSSRNPRGHQGPAAFIIKASGLDNHGLNSENQLCYSHIDIAPSAGSFPKTPSGAPIAALVNTFVIGH